MGYSTPALPNFTMKFCAACGRRMPGLHSCPFYGTPCASSEADPFRYILHLTNGGGPHDTNSYHHYCGFVVDCPVPGGRTGFIEGHCDGESVEPGRVEQ